MAIKIGGTSIIDDNKNISNVGIITVASGGTDGKIEVGTGATINGDGNVSIAGTLYALDTVVPIKLTASIPSNGQEGVDPSANLVFYFNKPIGIGSTGFIYLETKKEGAAQQTFTTYGVGSSLVSRTDAATSLTVTLPSNLPSSFPGAAVTVTPVISSTFLDDSQFLGVNTTGSPTVVKFQTASVCLGQEWEGGYLICKTGGVAYVVAPVSTELCRDWYSRNDIIVCACSVTGCTDWFIPTRTQGNTIGACNAQYWDTYTSAWYWACASTQSYQMPNGGGRSGFGYDQSNVWNTRAFRCVTY